MDSIASLIQTYGPTVAITIVFVWQSILREQRMTRRLDAQADLIERLLTETIARNTEALVRFTHVVSLKPCGVNFKRENP